MSAKEPPWTNMLTNMNNRLKVRAVAVTWGVTAVPCLATSGKLAILHIALNVNNIKTNPKLFVATPKPFFIASIIPIIPSSYKVITVSGFAKDLRIVYQIANEMSTKGGGKYFVLV